MDNLHVDFDNSIEFWLENFGVWVCGIGKMHTEKGCKPGEMNVFNYQYFDYPTVSKIFIVFDRILFHLNPRTPSLLLPAWHWYCLACNEKNEKVLFFCHRGKQRIWIVRFFRDLDTNHISWPNLILCSKGKTTTCHLLALDSIRSFFRPNFFEGRCYFKSKCYVLQETAGKFVFYPDQAAVLLPP